MKRNLWILILVLALGVSVLASCGGRHKHTFSEEWEIDDEYHWHPSTCGHGEECVLIPHVDADENGFCDDCEHKIGHKHTFVDEWTTNDTHHWKQATCTHTETKGEYEKHIDDIPDGSCDKCSVHIHNVNDAGYCKYCGDKLGEVDESSIEALAKAILAQAHLVNGGSISIDFIGRSNRSEDYARQSKQDIEFIFGNGYAYYKAENYSKTHDEQLNVIEASDTHERWYEVDGNGTFGLESYDGGKTLTLISSDPDKLYGDLLFFSSLANGNGAENLLYNIVLVLLDEGVSRDVSVTINPETNRAEFSFGAVVIGDTVIIQGDNVGETVYNVHYYVASVSFTYTDDYALTGFDATLDCYTNDAGAAGTMGPQNYEDIDIEYDPKTGEIKFVSYNPDTGEFEDAESATPDSYAFSITHTVGERTAVNDYPKTKFIPDNFNLYLNIDENGVLSNKFTGEAISVDIYESVRLYVGECIPEHTSLSFVADMIQVKLFKDGVEVENCGDPVIYTNPTAHAYITSSGDQSEVFFIGKEDGKYTIEISLLGKTLYSINVNAGVVMDDNIQLEDNQFAVKVTETYQWANPVEFTATEAGTYYFNLPSGVGFINADEFDAAKNPEDMPEPYFDYNRAQIVNGQHLPGSFSIELEAGETIRFYVNAVKRGVYVITFFN